MTANGFFKTRVYRQRGGGMSVVGNALVNQFELTHLNGRVRTSFSLTFTTGLLKEHPGLFTLLLSRGQGAFLDLISDPEMDSELEKGSQPWDD